MLKVGSVYTLAVNNLKDFTCQGARPTAFGKRQFGSRGRSVAGPQDSELTQICLRVGQLVSRIVPPTAFPHTQLAPLSLRPHQRNQRF